MILGGLRDKNYKFRCIYVPTELDIIPVTQRIGLRQDCRPEFYKPYPEAINKENPYPRGIEFLNSLYYVEKMDSPPWIMRLDS